MKNKIVYSIMLFFLNIATLQASEGVVAHNFGKDLSKLFNDILQPIVDFLSFLFLGQQYEFFSQTYSLKIFGFPILVGWLVIGGLFFTFKLNFVNLRLFTHGVAVIMGKYSAPDNKDPGRVTHAQAFFTAVSGTVGLGIIAGVSIAVTI